MGASPPHASLGPDQIRPLLTKLFDWSPQVVMAALNALVRLPLNREAWLQVSRQVGELLDHPGGSGLDDQAIIEVAAHVPTRSVRGRLHQLLQSPEERLRFTTAVALAGRGDPAGVPVLLAALAQQDEDERARTAEVLAQAELQPYLAQVQAAFQQESDPDTRLWLALALARKGETGEIQTVLKAWLAGRLDLRIRYGDPTLLTDKVARLGSFPPAARELFERLQKKTNDSFISDLVQASQPAAAQAGPEEPAPDPQQIQAAQDVAGRLVDPDNREAVENQYFAGLTQDELESLRALPPEEASTLVNYLYQLAAERGEFQNLGVELVHRLRQPFAPDIPALFKLFHQAQDNSSLRQQLAWTAAQAEVSQVIAGLEPALASQDEAERLAACQLVEYAARFSGSSALPMFGGGGAAPEVSPPEGLIDDEGLETSAPFGRISFTPPGAEAEESPAEEHKTSSAPPGRTRPRRRRVVNQGMAPGGQPDGKMAENTPLQADQAYWFWIDIGNPSRESITDTDAEVSSEIPEGAVIDVVLFGFHDELALQPGADRGRLKIQTDGHIVAETQPLGPAAPRSRKGEKRLFFPIRTPDREGEFRLRCHLYWGQLLLQSWLVTAQVAKAPAAGGQKAIRSKLEYNMTLRLDPQHLNRLPQHCLSMMLNQTVKGSHSFHLYGAQDETVVKQDDVRFAEGELQDMITNARGTLRLAAWGSTDEWGEGVQFRYQNQPRSLERLKEDLQNMAFWGWEFYTKIVRGLAGASAPADLAAVMRKPAAVQIAMKESPSYLLPAAMIYDHPKDNGVFEASFCPTFEAAFQAQTPLEETECFQGRCPAYGDRSVICPSGFWGYRHYLGMPLSLNREGEVAIQIPVQEEALHFVVGYADDMLLFREGQAEGHAAQLRSLFAEMDWKATHGREQFLGWLRAETPHVVYFYCHGGLVRRSLPYLQLGPNDMIMSSNFRDPFAPIRWQAPGPLVFINGCHTTAVEPVQAVEFISPLVREAGSAGVIGTEITIYEELARDFANECFRRFFNGETIGQAVRGARLKLLADGNPLGLVYVPFALAGLRLVKEG